VTNRIMECIILEMSNILTHTNENNMAFETHVMRCLQR